MPKSHLFLAMTSEESLYGMRPKSPSRVDPGDVPVVTEESRSEPKAGAHVQSSPHVPLERALVRYCRRRRRMPVPLVELGEQ